MRKMSDGKEAVVYFDFTPMATICSSSQGDDHPFEWTFIGQACQLAWKPSVLHAKPQSSFMHNDAIAQQGLSRAVSLVSFARLSASVEKTTYLGSGNLLCHLCRILVVLSSRRHDLAMSLPAGLYCLFPGSKLWD